MSASYASRTQMLNVIDPVEFADYATPVQYELPPEKGDVKLIDPEDMDELVRLLHEEAKVI